MQQYDSLRAITRRALRINYRSPLICQLGPEESGSSSGTDVSGFIPVNAPAGPTNLQSSVSECPRVVTLTWDAVTGALGYNILRAEDPVGPFIYRQSVDGLTFSEDVEDGVTFYYRVVAFGDFGQSNPSETLAVIVPLCE
jgi:hypothetical protein